MKGRKREREGGREGSKNIPVSTLKS